MKYTQHNSYQCRNSSLLHFQYASKEDENSCELEKVNKMHISEEKQHQQDEIGSRFIG